jgi:hypothetical protein
LLQQIINVMDRNLVHQPSNSGGHQSPIDRVQGKDKREMVTDEEKTSAIEVRNCLC